MPCWACTPVKNEPAAFIFIDGYGEKWPLCQTHCSMWLANDITRHVDMETVVSAVDELIAQQAEDGIEQLEEMLRTL